MTKRFVFIALTVLLFAACGGGDPGSPTTAASGSNTTAEAGSGPAGCDSIVTLDEVASLFGAPAVFDAESSEEIPGIGALSCVWTTVEDPDDLEDLQVLLFQVQVYEGQEFYSPDTWTGSEPLDGIGDDAFIAATDYDITTGFRDGDLVAIMSYTVIGSGDAPPAIGSRDTVVGLLRTAHDRLA